jgi:adenylate cyclase
VVERADHQKTLPAAAYDALLGWLLNNTYGERYLDAIFVEFCQRLERQGLPLARAAVNLRVDHPQWLGLRVLWRPGMTAADLRLRDREGDNDEEAFAVYLSELGTEFRLKLADAAYRTRLYPFLERLSGEGLTDYVAWPLRFTLGKRHLVSFSSSQPDGFADSDLRRLAELLPALSSVMEIRVKNRLARDLLDTYVGPHAGEAILAGAIHRGSGFTVEAAVIIVDLRGFTAI